MGFRQTYQIQAQYLPIHTKRRSGLLLTPGVKFVVAHDTGNAGSTAQQNVSHYIATADEVNASAHIFVDDHSILECVPATTGTPEKAWHVRYDPAFDNQLYGFEANDTAIGVEYCFGTNINADESYKRYVWVLAFLCFKFGLKPDKAVIGHFVLDPSRRTDPKTGLAASGRTYDQLLKDIVTEYNACTQTNQSTMRLIKNPSSQKVYAVGTDGKKHWIFNEETFLVGQAMGLWGSFTTIETVPDDGVAPGHTMMFVKN